MRRKNVACQNNHKQSAFQSDFVEHEHYQVSKKMNKPLDRHRFRPADLHCYLACPAQAGSRWNILIGLRPDFAIPLLAVSVCLGALGLIQVARRITALFPIRLNLTRSNWEKGKGLHEHR